VSVSVSVSVSVRVCVRPSGRVVYRMEGETVCVACFWRWCVFIVFFHCDLHILGPTTTYLIHYTRTHTHTSHQSHTFIHTMTGLWPHQAGVVRIPGAAARRGTFFVPQRPYLTKGSLRAQVCVCVCMCVFLYVDGVCVCMGICCL